jgi:glycosyltransferase involved in cell wall biosynthesis
VSSPPLRVLVLATTFPARAGDGTPEFVLTLASALQRSGMELTVLVPRVPGSRRSEVVAGVRVRRFAYFPRRWESLADGAIMANLREDRRRLVQVPPLVLGFLVAAWRAVRRGRPDVIHAHWIVPAGVVARLLKLLTGVPYIVTVHGADAYTLRSGLARQVKRSVLREAAATVPVSAAIGDELESLGPIEDPAPMGVDVARIRAEVGERKPEPGRVLFVGRLVEKKGVDVLLEAVARMDTLHLVVAGGGPLEHELRDQARRLAVESRVEFLGTMPHAQVMLQMARASVIALPSVVGAGGDQDGVPVVLAEAMAAGVPVVASDLGGLADHVEDGVTGRVVPAGSVEGLAAALLDLVSDPAEARRLAASASTYVEVALGIDVVRTRYIEILDAAVAP